MCALSIVFLLFFSIIAVVKSQSVPYFETPTNESIYFPGDFVNIKISYFSNVTGTLTRSCGSSISSVSITTNNPSIFQIPSTFVGNCTFSAAFSSPIPAPQSIYIMSKGFIVFVAVTTTMAAGSTVGVRLNYSPRRNPNYNFTVELDCNLPGVSPATALITGFITGQNFSIPQNFYGSQCIYSAFDPAGLYLMRNPSIVMITQQLVIQQPVTGQLVNYPNSFNTLITTGFVNIGVTLNVSITCVIRSRYLSFPSNTLSTITPTKSEFGNCKLSVPASPESYLVTPTATDISIKITLVYIDPPAKIYSGIPFPVYLNTTAPVNSIVTTVLNLNCSNTLIRQWVTLINTPTSNTITTPVASRNGCSLNIFPESTFFNQMLVPVIVANPVISSPSNGSTYAYDGQIPFTLSDASLYTEGTATQTCGTDVVTKTLNSTFQTIFDLPSDYLGKCSYSAMTNPASFIVPVDIQVVAATKPVQFVLPPIFPKQSVPAGTSFPVQLSYSPTTSPNLSFTVRLQCGALSKDASITGNEPSQLYQVPSDFSGTDCILSIVDAPRKYVPEGPRVIAVTQELTVVKPQPNEIYSVNSILGFLIETSLGTDYITYVTIACPGKTLEIPILSNRLTAQYFNPDYYGKCELSFEPELAFFVPPQPFDIFLKYILTYIGITKNITATIPMPIRIETSFEPGSLAPNQINLQLICQNLLVFTWENLKLNENIKITVPASAIDQVQCVFAPVENDYYQGISEQFDVIAATLPFFSSPVNGTIFPYGSSVTIVMSDVPPNTIVTVTQNCGVQILRGDLNSAYSFTFNLPVDYAGACYYTAISDPPSQMEITPLKLYAQGTASIVIPIGGDVFFAGSSMSVKLAYEPRTIPNPDFKVTLLCSDGESSQNISGADVEQSFSISGELYGYCSVSVEPSFEYDSLNEVQVLIQQKMTIESPLPDSLQVVDVPFPLLVTVPAKNSRLSYTSQIECGQEVKIIDNLVINQAQDVTLDASFIGSCTMNVITDDYFVVLPAPIIFTLKYKLTFQIVPSIIAVNLPFAVILTSSSTPVSPAPSSINLDLICGSDVIQTWSVELNQSQTLTLTVNPTNKNNCSLVTPFNDAYYYQVRSSVIIFTSPFSGNIYPMTEEQIVAFTNSILIVSSGFINQSIQN